jgi:hypothetical protein
VELLVRGKKAFLVVEAEVFVVLFSCWMQREKEWKSTLPNCTAFSLSLHWKAGEFKG